MLHQYSKYMNSTGQESFTEKQKAVFLMYCRIIRKYGDTAKLINKKTLYQEVADALFYKNHQSVSHIIFRMLKAGYSVNLDDMDTETREHFFRMDEICELKNDKQD